MTFFTDNMLRTAMLGTGRADAASQNGTTERDLLIQSAAAGLKRRAGFVPSRLTDVLPEPSPTVQRPLLGHRAVGHLLMMLHGHFSDCLPEWRQAVEASGKRLPDEYLPLVLSDSVLPKYKRYVLRDVLGERGRWLVEQAALDEWAWVMPFQFERVWWEGDDEQRVDAFVWMRWENPARAREVLQMVWQEETVTTRISFLMVFGFSLSMDDEPFLEACLHDPIDTFHGYAQRWLMQLPESRYSRELREQVEPCVSLNRRDMKLEVKPVAGGIFDVFELLRKVAPSVWCEKFDLTPAELLEAARNSDLSSVDLRGIFVDATIATQDAPIAPAFFPEHTSVLSTKQYRLLCSLLTPEVRESLAVTMLTSAERGFSGKSPVGYVLDSHLEMWSDALAAAFLDALERALRRQQALPLPNVQQSIKQYALYFPIKFKVRAMEVVQVIGGEGQHREDLWDTVFGVLDFREDMLTAIHEDA